MTYSSWSDFYDGAEGRQGMLKIQMRKLRDVAGYDRLGPHVVSEISEKLLAEGMTHLPNPLPHQDQERVVRIYVRDSIAWRLVQAGRNPSRAGDRVMRSAVIAMGKAEKFDLIKDIVCPDTHDDED